MARTPSVVSLSDLQTRVSWVFFGIRDYSSLDTTSKAIIDEIISDGYEQFLSPPLLPEQRKQHRWNFIRPYTTITTIVDQSDYSLPSNFGSLDGPLFYQGSDNKWIPLTKTDPNQIKAWRQRDSGSLSGPPTKFAVVSSSIDGTAIAVATLMVWPAPDAIYALSGRYYVVDGPLSATDPYHPGDAYHNQTLIESCLAIAEERLEDGHGIHYTKFIERLRASISHDVDQYSSDYLQVDRDRSDRHHIDPADIHIAGDNVGYNGYVPGG